MFCKVCWVYLYNNTFPSYVGNSQAIYPVGETLTTYRFAGALTEQANNEVADGTVEGGLAWIVAMVNQINLLWVRDLSFRLQLIENNDLIIFTDSNPAPDDFKQVVPNDFSSFYCSYDKDRLASVFEDSHADIRKKYQDLIINIPIKDGTKKAFKISKARAMHPKLNSKYPSIRTYIGVGLINPSERASIVLYDAGLFGLVISDVVH